MQYPNVNRGTDRAVMVRELRFFRVRVNRLKNANEHDQRNASQGHNPDESTGLWFQMHTGGGVRCLKKARCHTHEGGCKRLRKASKAEQFAQTLCLGAAYRDFGLLLIVHA
jgi:hypothetical protein